MYFMWSRYYYIQFIYKETYTVNIMLYNLFIWYYVVRIYKDNC